MHLKVWSPRQSDLSKPWGQSPSPPVTCWCSGEAWMVSALFNFAREIKSLPSGRCYLLRKQMLWLCVDPCPAEESCLCLSLLMCYSLAVVWRSFRPVLPLCKRNGAAAGCLSLALPMSLVEIIPNLLNFRACGQPGLFADKELYKEV